MKIVINKCYGSYSLSDAACDELGVPRSNQLYYPDCSYAFDDDRANPRLVACVEKLGDAANGHCAKLRVIEIPDGVEWEIDEYDGHEQVREKSRCWS